MRPGPRGSSRAQPDRIARMHVFERIAQPEQWAAVFRVRLGVIMMDAQARSVTVPMPGPGPDAAIIMAPIIDGPPGGAVGGRGGLPGHS